MAASSPESKPRVISAEELRQRESQTSSSAQSTQKRITPGRKKPLPANFDIRKTKEYKSASRKWVSTIVALPILFYTTWELYERTYGSKVQKSLVEVNKKAVGESSSPKVP